jgi:hypothetical protein
MRKYLQEKIKPPVVVIVPDEINYNKKKNPEESTSSEPKKQNLKSDSLQLGEVFDTLSVHEACATDLDDTLPRIKNIQDFKSRSIA